MKTILLVDDEKDIVEFLKYSLEKEGFSVLTAYNGEEAMMRIPESPDLVILDVMMPKMDGYEVCRRIRADRHTEKLPIIFLTAKSSEIDEINGLNLGANDYIPKPISPNLLIARVKSNLRNLELQSPGAGPGLVTVGPITIDREKYTVYIEEEETVFPRKEFELLYFLARNSGKVLGREAILREIWGTDVYVLDRTIDVHIRKIREKLGTYADQIETIKGVGYRFREFPA